MSLHAYVEMHCKPEFSMYSSSVSARRLEKGPCFSDHAHTDVAFFPPCVLASIAFVLNIMLLRVFLSVQ